jgi:glucuronoarabinoxylan endo-1,4-beta-xylanase
MFFDRSANNAIFYNNLMFKALSSIIGFIALITTLFLAELTHGTPVCAVNWTDTQQHIDGFGFSSAWCGQLTSAKNNALYNTLGMSILRVRIDETGAWSQETANASAAHAAGVKVLGSPWSAPVVWTSNGSNSGGYLLPSHYADYANWLSNAAVSMNLDYVSIQNEPDYSAWMNWTAAEIFNFMKTNAPAIGKPIVMPESFHFNDTYSDPVINDSTAVTNFSILGGHFYGGGNYVHTNAIAHGKPVWMTEHYETGGTTNFPICLTWAKEINDAMNNQFNAYIAWWVQDGDTNINLANSSGTILKDGYTIGQFAKFIRPGFYRIGTTNTVCGAQISAYKDLTSSNYVIVALNLGSTVITQQFNLNGFPAMPNNPSITPWITSYTQSLAAQTPMTNVSSSFTYSIQPSNIVTLVGTPPVSAPTGLSATGGNNKVDLSWSAVTGASSYIIKRATVSGGPYTPVGSPSATSYSDTGLAAQTTYYYVVSAIADGGQSFDSLEASATTPLVYTNTTVADSYVESSNPNSNFGTLTNLWVKNSSGTASRNAYLMFDVHALTNARSATVTLTANRVDAAATMYYELAPTNWTENGITWNNQPGGTGVFLMTNIVSATGVAAVFDVTSAAASQATNGGLLAIRVTQQANSGNTLIQYCSKEFPTNSMRPMLTYSVAANTPPTLAPVTNMTIGVGTTLNITNSATDSDVPAQTLTFSLLTSPTNAVIGTNSGVLTWRPLITQADTTNSFTVMVADNGTPSMSATQSFVVTVIPLAQPLISAITPVAGQMVLQVNGANGPDYQIQSSTDLVNWSVVFTTNSPVMPFVWTTTYTDGPSNNFFRINVGPPF